MPSFGGNVDTVPWPISIQFQASAIKAACQRWNVPVPVFMGMYNEETSLGTNVTTSTAGAIGPFQFEPFNGPKYGYPLTNTPDLLQFQNQAYGAAHLLRDNYDQFGKSWHTALAVYNAGPANNGAAGNGYADAALAFQIPSNWASALGVASGSGFSTSVSGAAVGAGGAGTSPNQAQPAPFSIGSTASPHEDFWTAINRLAQERQWYVFSDSETLYLADGADLMQQPPALTLDRWADSDRIVDIEFTWDNSAFQYTASRIKKKHHVQHKSTLAKVASPVECTLHVICDIDEIRAGDVVSLSGCGSGDGKWLVGDCTRSVFNVYSELTLVPSIAALTEFEVAGAGKNSSTTSTATTGSPVANNGVGGPATGSVPNTPGGGYTPTTWAQALLQGLGIPAGATNVTNIVAWETQEGGHWHNAAKFNPLNTTQHEPGSTNPGFSAGVQAYTSWAQGLQASVTTLNNGLYPGILAALRNNVPLAQFKQAVNSSPWGTVF